MISIVATVLVLIQSYVNDFSQVCKGVSIRIWSDSNVRYSGMYVVTWKYFNIVWLAQTCNKTWRKLWQKLDRIIWMIKASNLFNIFFRRLEICCISQPLIKSPVDEAKTLLYVKNVQRKKKLKLHINSFPPMILITIICIGISPSLV